MCPDLLREVCRVARGEGPFANVAALTAAGITAAKNVGAVIYLSAGGTGAVPCLAFSDGTNWKQIAIGANAI